jgi:hypothetical protein
MSDDSITHNMLTKEICPLGYRHRNYTIMTVTRPLNCFWKWIDAVTMES